MSGGPGNDPKGPPDNRPPNKPPTGGPPTQPPTKPPTKSGRRRRVYAATRFAAWQGIGLALLAAGLLLLNAVIQ